uniref:Cytochrome P450, family 2, subfamily AE, polypeptide 1 n=1 Tax=Sphaeramia orbicularis TaxID=375764 RepID=A0A673ALQ9_9TELE
MDSLFSGFFVNLDATALLLFIVVFILTADYIKNRRLTGFPPGPPALPIVGNIFTLDHKRTHESMTESLYGDVYSLRMGQRWVVVLNGFEAVTQALVTQGDSFSDRPGLPLQADTFHGLGVIFSSGNIWKQQRRFALSTLKYFGFGKKSLEPVILEEFTYVAKEISAYKGKPFNPHLIINNTVANIICLLVFGHRFEYGDEQFKKMMKLFKQSSEMGLYNAFPQLMRRLPGPHQKFKRVIEELKDFIRTEVKDHKQKWDPSDLQDYIDYYLNEIQTDDSTFDEECLIMSVFDLFAAGSETTSTTLRWAFLYMVKYPEIQERVQAEIDSVIGQSRPPSVDDRADLPYTDAVIHEVQRMGNIAPLRYTIPKGVIIVPNLTSVLFDKSEWKTPFTFNPGHFLNEEGKFVKPAAFIPFSAGKRLCLGENLARMELFLFFTSFMQRFTFSMPPGVKPVLDYRFGLTLSPVHYEICAKQRHE